MDIMIDTEFLSFRMDSIILSVGAVAFDRNAETFKIISEFYEVPTIDSQRWQGKLDGSVFEFWLAQDSEAKKAILEHPNKKGIVGVLIGLHSWMHQFNTSDSLVRVWSHGAACDLPLLSHTCQMYGLEVPWHYQSPRDTRTLFDFAPTEIPKFEAVEGEPEHHAFWDAVRQAKQVHAVSKAVQKKLK